MDTHATAFTREPDRVRFKGTDTFIEGAGAGRAGRVTATLFVGSVKKTAHPDSTGEINRRLPVGTQQRCVDTYSPQACITGRRRSSRSERA